MDIFRKIETIDSNLSKDVSLLIYVISKTDTFKTKIRGYLQYLKTIRVTLLTSKVIAVINKIKFRKEPSICHLFVGSLV